jgi:hypothetical protein
VAQALIGYNFFTTNCIKFPISCFFKVNIYFFGHVNPISNNLTLLKNYNYLLAHLIIGANMIWNIDHLYVHPQFELQ